MAKGSRGGKRASGGGATVTLTGTGNQGPTLQAQNDQVQIDTTQQAQAMSAGYDNFMAMSDDDKADAINNLTKQNVPVFLADNDYQKLTYSLGMNDKPQLVDDGVLDTMNGTELFRTVNNVYDRQNDIGYSADMIASQIQRGSVTRVSDSGGSAYGRGIYFASDYGESTVYGNRSGNIQKTAVVRCKLNSNAKVITDSRATAGVRAEIRAGTKLGKALSKCDSPSQRSIYALCKGYNVIWSGHSYYNVLNRNAVTMSKDIKSMSNKWK